MQEVPYRSSRICRILGNPVTFQILSLVVDAQLTPSQMAKRVNRSVSTVSLHLSKLRLADLVRYEKKGLTVSYRAKYPGKTRQLLQSLKQLVAQTRGTE